MTPMFSLAHHIRHLSLSFSRTVLTGLKLCSYAMEHRWFICPAEYADSLADCLIPTAWIAQEWQLPELVTELVAYVNSLSL